MRSVIFPTRAGVVIACLVFGCASPDRVPPEEHATPGVETRPTPSSGDSSVIRPPLGEVLARQSGALLEVPGVTGTGEGRRGEEPLFVIFVVRKTEALERRLPRALEGYPVEIRESGEVTAPPR